MTLSTKIDVDLVAMLSSALDLGSSQFPLNISARTTLTSGTGVGQADLVFSDRRTVAASGTDALDLAGSLASPLGGTLTFVKIKGLLVRADTGNTNSVRVNRPAANGVPIFAAAGDAIDVQPGGTLLWIAPKTGVVVTPATGDLLNCDNSGAGTGVTYDIVIIGTSA